MEEEVKEAVSERRLAYRIGDRLPKFVRGLYYLVLTVTVVYWVYRLIAAIFEIVRSLGELIFKGLGKTMNWIADHAFSKDYFYVYVITAILAIVICMLLCEFVFDLEVFDKIINWALEIWETFKSWCTQLANKVFG